MKGESSAKLRQLVSWVQGIESAMLTSEDREGRLRSRPMVALQQYPEDAIWFFTEASSHKVDDIQGHKSVNVSYTDSARGRYVSVSGRARVVRDRSLLQELWHSRLTRWFPKGPGDPDLALLRIEVSEAEVWHAPDQELEVSVSISSGEGSSHETLTFA